MPRPSVDDLLDLSLARVANEVPEGVKPAATIAKRIGLSYQRVYRWYEEPRGLDAEGLIAILDGFGWLSIPEDDRVAAGLPPDPLVRLAEAVEEIGETQKEILARLPAKPEAPARARQADPKRSAKQ